MSQYVENIIQEKMDKINSKGNVYEVGRVIGVTDFVYIALAVDLIHFLLDKINSKGNVYEVGRVIGVTDYIVEVSGLIQVSFNEKVVIAGHSIGYVSLIRRNSILEYGQQYLYRR